MCNMLILFFDVCNEGVVPSPEEEITRKNAIEKLKQILSLSLSLSEFFVVMFCWCFQVFVILLQNQVIRQLFLFLCLVTEKIVEMEGILCQRPVIFASIYFYVYQLISLDSGAFCGVCRISLSLSICFHQSFSSVLLVISSFVCNSLQNQKRLAFLIAFSFLFLKVAKLCLVTEKMVETEGTLCRKPVICAFSIFKFGCVSRDLAFRFLYFTLEHFIIDN